MKINPNDYKPDVKGKSDKYSWNIYRFLKKYKQFNIRVYKIGWCGIKGRVPVEEGQYFIGIQFEENGFTGLYVRRLMTDGKIGSNITAAQCDSIDVTEWFFKKYRRYGRCFIVNDWAHKWVSITRNSRKCAYCGEWQYRSVKTVKRIERDVVWR